MTAAPAVCFCGQKCFVLCRMPMQHTILCVQLHCDTDCLIVVARAGAQGAETFRATAAAHIRDPVGPVLQQKGVFAIPAGAAADPQMDEDGTPDDAMALCWHAYDVDCGFNCQASYVNARCRANAHCVAITAFATVCRQPH